MKKIDIQFLPLNGGRFISRGRGRHPTRKIDSDELIYVIHGKLDVFEEQQIFSVKSGEWLILRKGRKHGGLNDYGNDLSYFWIHFVDENGFLANFPSKGAAVHEDELSSYFHLLINEQQLEDTDIESQKLLMLLIFRELQRSKKLDNKSISVTPLAEAAHQIIKLRYTETLNVEIISSELKCNAEYLGRIYRFYYGKSIIQEINDLRIDYAARLLSNSSDSIKEIVFRSGFNDPAYFRRQFVRHYALTPAKFRKKYRYGNINSN